MIKVTKKPSFKSTISRLDKLDRVDVRHILHEYGKKGVQALSRATPVDTGETAQLWSYEITGNKKQYRLKWFNSATVGSVPLVIILQYGHATKSGYFINGRDFVNPALDPIYQALRNRLSKEIG